jgi:hypothetical protein
LQIASAIGLSLLEWLINTFDATAQQLLQKALSMLSAIESAGLIGYLRAMAFFIV